MVGLIGFSAAGAKWLWIAGVFLAVAAVVSVLRRMLGGFSRKKLLDGLAEAERARFEEILPRSDEHERALHGIEHALRLCFVSCLAFAAFFRAGEGAGALEEILAVLLFIAAAFIISVTFLSFVPSVIARIHPEAALRSFLPFLDRLHSILAPAVKRYGGMVKSSARALGAAAEPPAADAIQEEILSAVEEGERKGVLREGETSMIESIIRFRDREVSEVMTPRTEMVCIDIEESLSESVRAAIDCGHSRIPVYRDNKDNIVGILYVKDLLRFWNQGAAASVRLADIIRQPHFTPESKKVSELFHEFRSQRFHIAIILDEFGGTSGLITIEDIIEDIVGEIVDEFEKGERPEFQKISAEIFEVDARLPVRDLNERLGLDLPEGDGYDTVGGFLFSAMGKVPAVGDSHKRGNVLFEVIEADERKINRLRIRIARPLEGGEA